MTNTYQEREPMRCIPSLSADSPPLAIANSYELVLAEEGKWDEHVVKRWR